MDGVATKTVLRALGVALFVLGLALLAFPGPAFIVLLVGLVLLVLSFVVPARSS